MKTEKKAILPPAFTLLLLSLGGLLIHLRMHPITENPANFVPFVFGIVNSVLVILFFINNNTAVIAYLINGFGVIIGIIMMVDFSLSNLPYPLTIGKLFLKTTFPYILILFAKLLPAHIILMHYFPSGTGRLFTLFWWFRHFLYVTVIYILGHLL
jgi:hypothetical protein